MNRPHAILFDLDGTLLDGSRLPQSIAATCESIAERAGIDARTLLDVNTRVWPQVWGSLEPAWIRGRCSTTAVTVAAWDRTLRSCGCDDPMLPLLASQTQRRLGRDSYRLFDDGRALHSHLRSRGIRMALVTNGGSDLQREKIDALGIADWFDAIAISADLGVAKPDVEIFSVVLDRLGCDRDATWHIGDSVPCDIAGATASAIRSVWVNRRGATLAADDPRPDFEITTLTELIDLL